MGINIKVPASTANLGAGFDTLGIALNLYNEFYIEESEEDEIITIPKNSEFENPEKNLFFRVLKDVLKMYGEEHRRFKVKQINRIPISRGLGSSASVIVGGIVAGFKILDKNLDDKTFFDIAYRYENHPDNLIPAYKGGFITALKDGDKTYYQKLFFPDEIKFIVVIPDFELSTEEARKVLPENIPLKDAIFNIQRVALFISALQNRKYELLKIAMEDRLHQPYRKKLIPEFDNVIRNAYSNGALGVSLSGAGSSIVALAKENFDAIGKAMVDTFSKVGIKAEYKILEKDDRGVYLTED